VPTCGSVGLANHVKWWPCGHSTEDGRTIVTLDGADDKDGRSDKVIKVCKRYSILAVADKTNGGASSGASSSSSFASSDG
jgi:hypothetical protein